jgi:hypothetical protein
MVLHASLARAIARDASPHVPMLAFAVDLAYRGSQSFIHRQNQGVRRA